MTLGTAAIWGLDLLCSLGVWLGVGAMGLLIVLLGSYLLLNDPAFDNTASIITVAGLGLLIVLAARWVLLARKVAVSAIQD